MNAMGIALTIALLGAGLIVVFVNRAASRRGH
jgi:uncharacterized MnhB-related membrane protein